MHHSNLKSYNSKQKKKKIHSSAQKKNLLQMKMVRKQTELQVKSWTIFAHIALVCIQMSTSNIIDLKIYE